tara:strand:- start:42 stop:203 length:162 start_codon:yes stop_codon:yes gene_type:complete
MNHDELMAMKFEQTINILIMYKQEHSEKDVYLSEKSLKEAIKWYKTIILKNMK